MKRLAPVVLPLLLSACALGQVGAVIHPTVSGSLDVRNADGTQTQLTLDRCSSGDRSYFLGFDFSSSRGPDRLRAIQEPTGGIVVRWTTPEHTVVLGAHDCGKLELDVQPTGWQVNDVRELAGHLELQCQAADGSRIAGRVAVDHCH